MTRAVLSFEAGTLSLTGDLPDPLPPEAAAHLKFDPRTSTWRGRGADYASIVVALLAAGVPLADRAKGFSPVDLTLQKELVPRPHQRRAFDCWRRAGSRGIAELPTGAGKTVLAVMAMAAVARPTLVLVPTIDLLQQWTTVLEDFFGVPVGMLGGGEHRIETLTVSTYDSAALQMEFIGNRFCLLVADECHHLPGPVYRIAAEMAIAPFRLGLSATPESGDERDDVLTELLGPVVCRVGIGELERKYLSGYRTERIEVPLDADEEASYRHHHRIYTDFLKRHGIAFRSPADWGRFLGLCARSPEGKQVLASFFEQRRIARSGRAKVRMVERLLRRHAGERIILFTADNAGAYLLGRRFALPVITHRTGVRERKAFLDGFRSGLFPVLVTSKVLNEGVDVPEAGVGIVLSGSASVREHVQRLGRILRPAPGKDEAVLYELVGAGTTERSVSRRRREHEAYRGRRGGSLC